MIDDFTGRYGTVHVQSVPTYKDIHFHDVSLHYP